MNLPICLMKLLKSRYLKYLVYEYRKFVDYSKNFIFLSKSGLERYLRY